ncbi:hypothetical protein Agub_g10980, partial [Astrephomene gubernaculifera]
LLIESLIHSLLLLWLNLVGPLEHSSGTMQAALKLFRSNTAERPLLYCVNIVYNPLSIGNFGCQYRCASVALTPHGEPLKPVERKIVAGVTRMILEAYRESLNPNPKPKPKQKPKLRPPKKYPVGQETVDESRGFCFPMGTLGNVDGVRHCTTHFGKLLDKSGLFVYKKGIPNPMVSLRSMADVVAQGEPWTYLPADLYTLQPPHAYQLLVEGPKMKKKKKEPAAVTATPDIQKPAAVTATPDIQKPAAVTATPDIQKPAAVTAIPDIQKPAAVTATPDIQKPAAVTATPDIQKPAAVTATPDIQKPPSSSQDSPEPQSSPPRNPASSISSSSPAEAPEPAK